MNIYKVLLLEDDPKSAEITVRILEKFNFKVDHVLDARLGTTKLKNNYDLIISDVMMPVIDGFTFIERNKEQIKDTPILMLTALKEKEDILRAASLKIVHYLTKPFEQENLIQKACEALKIDKDDLLLKKNFELKIYHEVMFESGIKIFIKGMGEESTFIEKTNEFLVKLQSITTELKLVTLFINSEFYFCNNSISLVENFIELTRKKFHLSKDGIQLKGDFFSRLTNEERKKSNILI